MKNDTYQVFFLWNGCVYGGGLIHRFWSPKSSIESSSISGHFSGIISNSSSLTSPWMTISSSPVTDEPHANFVPKNFAATFKSISVDRRRKQFSLIRCSNWSEKCVANELQQLSNEPTKSTKACHNGHALPFAARCSRNADFFRSIFFDLFRFEHALSAPFLTFLFIFTTGGAVLTIVNTHLGKLRWQILFQPCFAFLIVRIVFTILPRKSRAKINQIQF